MKKFKLLAAAVLASTTIALASCGPKGSITSFSIQDVAKKVVGLNRTITLTVNISKDGEATDEVEWSVDNPDVAEITPNGKSCKVKGLKVGSFVISVKSKFDNSKVASMNFEVVDMGPRPEFYDEGYSYSKEWPAAEAKAFAGFDIPAFSASEGFYFVKNEEDPDPEEGHVASFEIVLEYSDDYYDGYQDILDKANYFYFFDDCYEVEAYFDPTRTVEIDFEAYPVDDEGEDYVLSFTLYKVEDIWGDDSETSDTAWNEKLAKALSDEKIDLPFVKLGSQYTFDDSEGIYIYDICSDFNKLNGYGDKLVASGYTKNEDQEGVYYSKPIDEFNQAIVSFGFTGYGNTISAYVALKEVDVFPAEALAAFIAKEGSTMSLPAFSWNDKAKFTYYSGEYEDEESGDKYNVAEVTVLNTSESECVSFVTELIKNGFVKDDEASYEKQGGYSYVSLKKGKLEVGASLVYSSREATETEINELLAISDEDLEKMSDTEYYEWLSKYFELMMTGTFSVPDYSNLDSGIIDVSIDPSAREIPGLYLVGKEPNVNPGADAQLNIEAFMLGDPAPAISYVSENPSIATVSDSGLVHGVALGETKITASCSYGGKDYSLDINVKVSNQIVEKVEFKTEFSSLTKLSPIDTKVVTTTAGTKISFGVGSSASKQAPQYQPSDFTARLYVGNDMTIKAPDGKSIIGIEITGTPGDGGTLKADKGSLVANDSGYSWSGSESEVKLSCATSKHYRITAVEITIA